MPLNNLAPNNLFWSKSITGAVSDLDGSPNKVTELSSSGTAVGITAKAVDPDQSDTVSYRLIDNANGKFTINPNTGVVTVAGSLDYEAINGQQHNIVIKATSTDGSFPKQITIEVLDDLSDNDYSSKVSSLRYWHDLGASEANQLLIELSEDVDPGWSSSTSDFSAFFDLKIDGASAVIADVDSDQRNKKFKLTIEEGKEPDEHSHFELLVKDGAFTQSGYSYLGGTYEKLTPVDIKQADFIGRPTRFGSASDDKMSGGDVSGALKLHGGKGKDELTGGKGHDEIDGGDDSDVLFGGDGSDKLSVEKITTSWTVAAGTTSCGATGDDAQWRKG